MNIDHPDITNAIRTGHSIEDWEAIQQRQNDMRVAYDYYGELINLNKDEYVVTPNKRFVLPQHLQLYLEDQGYKFNYEVGGY